MKCGHYKKQHEHPYLKKVVFVDDSSRVEWDSVSTCNIENVVDVSLVLIHQKQDGGSNEIIGEDDLIKQKYLIAIYGDISVESSEGSTVKAKAVYIKLNYFVNGDGSDCFVFNDLTLKHSLSEFAKLFHSYLSKFYQSKPLFDIYLQPIDIKSFCIYFITQWPNEKNITKVFQQELTNMDTNMKRYSEFILEQLRQSEMFAKDISTTLLEVYFKNFMQYKQKFQNYSLLNDVENLCDLLSYLVLCYSSDSSNEEAFYNLLLKINDFYKKKFFFCCGMSNVDEINYSKSPYVFCFDCKKLICAKCFTFHRTHYYFDFCCIIKYKHGNIHSKLSTFLKYADKNENSLCSLKPVEDSVLKKLISEYHDSQAQAFSVFDAMDLFLKEHLTKLAPLIKFKFENETQTFTDMYLSKRFVSKEERSSTERKEHTAYKELIQNVTHKLKRQNTNQNKASNSASPFEDIINIIIKPSKQQPQFNKAEPFIANHGTVLERIDLENVIESNQHDKNDEMSPYLNLVGNTSDKGAERKYIDGFGSLFHFVMFYLERVYDEMLNFGNQYYPIN